MSDLEEGTTGAPRALFRPLLWTAQCSSHETLVSQLYPQPEKVDYKELPVLLRRLKGLPISSGLPVYSLLPPTAERWRARVYKPIPRGGGTGFVPQKEMPVSWGENPQREKRKETEQRVGLRCGKNADNRLNAP